MRETIAMTSKVLRGFRTVPKQDGSGKVTIERVPYFGMDASAKLGQKARNRSKTRKRVKVVKRNSFAAIFSPAKK